MKLTIGMAHHTDYLGLWPTLHALRLYHDTADVEFVVVDNSPDTADGKGVHGLCQMTGARYVPLPEAVGTSVPRDRIFREATGDVVLCMDCHVFVLPGGLDVLRAYFADRRNAKDIVSGPIVNDAGGLYATQFNDVWRAEMWGVWGKGWRCKCGRSGLQFTPLETDDGGIRYVRQVSQKPVKTCRKCHTRLPAIEWAGHEKALTDAGYVCVATERSGEPFEIPGMGLGLFAMRRDAWPGFHPDARGFGGEELYIHEKVRRAGGRAMCLPRLPWLHRFFRPRGVAYPADKYRKARNYVLEFTELNLPLDPIREHFVQPNLLPAEQWEHLIADPVANAEPPDSPGCNTCGKSSGVQPPESVGTLDEAYEWARRVPRDLDRHAGRIRELCSQVDRVTLLVKRREWDVFALAGRPDVLSSYTTESDLLHERLAEIVAATETNPAAKRRLKYYHRTKMADSLAIDQIEETDLLIIDTVHSAERIYAELSRFAPAVKRWVLVRGTGSFGLEAENEDAPGLFAGIRRYLHDNPQWSVLWHTADQYGLTLLGCHEKDKPKRPSVVEMAATFAAHLAEHVADGMKKVEADELKERLETCTLCEHRTGEHCSVCGCKVAAKAQWRSSDCDLAKWPGEVPAEPDKKAA